MWRELISELIHWALLLGSVLAMRWLLELSTPAVDISAVTGTAKAVWQAMQIPDWRESFNMEKLEWLRRRFQFEREQMYEQTNNTIVVVDADRVDVADSRENDHANG